MVDDVPKLAPYLFRLDGLEVVKAVRRKPEESKEEPSEAEDEGLMAQREKLRRERGGNYVPTHSPQEGVHPCKGG